MTEIIDVLADNHATATMRCSATSGAACTTASRPFPRPSPHCRTSARGGGTVVLLTNAPRPGSGRSSSSTGSACRATAWDTIVSSGDASRDAMFAGAVGHGGLHHRPQKDQPSSPTPLTGCRRSSRHPRVPLDQAEGIVCTGLADDLTETPADYRAQFLLAKRRPEAAVRQSRYRRRPGRQARMVRRRPGAAYTEMGGDSLYFGKPHPPIYDLARRRLAALGRSVATTTSLPSATASHRHPGGMAEDLDTLFITGGLAAAESDRADAPDPALLQAWSGPRSCRRPSPSELPALTRPSTPALARVSARAIATIASKHARRKVCLISIAAATQ